MSLFLRLMTYVWRYWSRLGAAIVCSALVAACTLAIVQLIGPLFSEVLVNKNATWVVLVPVLLIAVTLLKGLTTYGQSYLMSYVGARVVTDLRQQLFEHLLRLPMGFHLRNPSSHMLSRVINDINVVKQSVGSVLKDLFQHSLTFLGLLSYVLYLNWKLTLLGVVVVPFSVLPIVRFGARLRRLASRAQERTADMSLVLQESLTGMRIVKAFTREETEGRRFEKENQAYFRALMKSAQVLSLTSPVLEVVGIIGIAGIIWYGGWQVIQGQMEPEEFLKFFTAAFLMYNPIKRLAGVNNYFQEVLAAAQRVFSVLDEPTERVMDRGTSDLKGVEKSIEFRDVSFRYDGVQDFALEHVSLAAPAGTVVALVGSSGAGKTTLVNLIPRFFDPTDGAILIDGVDLRDIRLAELRRNIGVVSQDTLLFDAPVWGNIAYGRDACADSAVAEAAKAAYAHDFIMGLPDRYDTFIGENGVKLSGGERQRLAIARAILRDPPILILDEATSALDSESERMVQMALSNLMKGRTTFVIAHRLSTVQHADRIAVLDQARLVELGTHEELLRRGGVYKRLHAIQFSGEAIVNT